MIDTSYADSPPLHLQGAISLSLPAEVLDYIARYCRPGSRTLETGRARRRWRSRMLEPITR